MRVRPLLIALLTIATVLGIAQLALQRYASVRLQQALAQCRDWAAVEVGHHYFWLWGEARLRDVRIVPQPWLTAIYGLPLGFRIRIDQLRLHRLRFAWHDGLQLRQLDITPRGIHLPLPDWQWSIVVARDAAHQPMPAPTLQDLGVTSLAFDAALRLRFPQALSRPQLLARGRLTGLGAVAVDCGLMAPPGALRDPGMLALTRCRLEYQDLGLAQRFEAQMARINDVDLTTLRRAINLQFRHAARRAHWPPLSTQSVQGFIDDPQRRLRLQMAPPRPLPLNHIPRGLWPGLPALLGLSAALPTAAMPEWEMPPPQ